jgi:putative hydrolase of the HAD superfamily
MSSEKHTSANTIKAVLFDYGMVLSAPPLPAAWERMKAITGQDEAGLHGGYWGPRHEYDRGTYTGEEFWRLVAGHSGITLDDGQVEQLIAADVDLWGELNPPMIEWVHRLQRAGIRTGILSNMPDAMAAGLSAKYEWIRNFDHLTWSHSLKLAKPELAIYRHAVEGLETPAEAILFIDDKLENIAAAEQAGMQAIQYSSHGVFEREMNARGFGDLLLV